jgi:tripartite-type tricarboxylate transporter receptor subunit TctC
VENRPGGGTIIGVEAVARAAPDGYTLAVVASTHVTLPLLYDKVPFDPIADFTPVTPLASGEQVLLVHPSIEAKDVSSFIAWAKERPGQLNYASSGGGSPTNLAGEQFKLVTGLNIQHIPYKGAAPAITDLIGGQVHMSFQNLAVALPHIKSGKVRALAISGKERSPALPEVPTFEESGVGGFDAKFWFGVLAPKGTPRPIVDRLAAELARAVSSPDLKASLEAQGLQPYSATPDAFAEQLLKDRENYAKVIKAGNIRIDN